MEMHRSQIDRMIGMVALVGLAGLTPEREPTRNGHRMTTERFAELKGRRDARKKHRQAKKRNRR